MTEKLPHPEMDLSEYLGTLASIKQWEKDGVDCKALIDYIEPLKNSKRVNLNYGEITTSRDNQ